MEELQCCRGIRSLNLGFESNELIIAKVLVFLERSLRCEVTLVDFLREIEQERSSAVGLVPRDKVLMDDLRGQLIRIRQVT